jgi:hypothetical protein
MTVFGDAAACLLPPPAALPLSAFAALPRAF